MIDLVSFNKSLKTTWIKKYLDSTNNGKWKVFIDLALKNHGCKNVFNGNLNTKDTKKSPTCFSKKYWKSGRKLILNSN